MADTAVKPTDPAPEPTDEVKARVAYLQGRDSDYTRGEITAHSEDDTVKVGKGGIRHFDGTVVKVNKDGDRVLSSYVDADIGEKLAADVEAEEEAARAAKAREKGTKSAAGKSPDTAQGQSVDEKPKDAPPAGGTGAPPADNSGSGAKP